MKAAVLALVVFLVVEVRGWTYDERQFDAPSRWGEVRGKNGALRYPTCANMGTQSPINVCQSVIDTEGVELQLSWIESNNYTIINNGEDITIEFHDVVSKLSHGGNQYEFKYAQVHAPSAHTFGSGKRDGEFSLVHEIVGTAAEDASQFVVISVSMFASYGHHDQLTTLIDAIPVYRGTSVTADSQRSLSLKKFVPSDPDALLYKGSLMQPPCTEGAEFYVMKQPIHISHLQLAAIKNKRGASPSNNVRPTQHLGTRKPLRIRNSRVSTKLDAVRDVEEISVEEIFALCALSFAGLSSIVSIAALLIACCTERRDEN